MDDEHLKQNIINLLAINFDQTGHEEMEVAEIASHLRLSTDHVKQVVYALVGAEMVRMTPDDRCAALLQKGYGEAQRS